VQEDDEIRDAPMAASLSSVVPTSRKQALKLIDSPMPT
jgi:hypothetical protein